MSWSHRLVCKHCHIRCVSSLYGDILLGYCHTDCKLAISPLDQKFFVFFGLWYMLSLGGEVQERKGNMLGCLIDTLARPDLQNNDW